WKFAPDKMLYATYSKGFRPGGVNRIAGPNGKPYEPDYLKNYEIGWKTEWLDRRLRWNAALFWEDWKNFQFGFLVPPSITAITNAGNARIKGWENDLIFQPTHKLMMSANFTWLHAVTTENFCATVGVTDCPNDTTGAPFLPPTYTWTGPLAPAGTDLPQVPKFKGNAVLRYQFDDIASWSPFGQAAFMYQTKTAPHLKGNEQAVIGFAPAYGLLDLSAGATSPSQATQITLFISNVTDKRAQLTRFTNISANNMNQVYVVPAQPRTFGIQVSQNF
ncbi:MAG: TonB-dependent receptor, partial [Sinobacteraceae bacterium]|nr:TonB-dependent receptor [Nevskiaceae bacterium]